MKKVVLEIYVPVHLQKLYHEVKQKHINQKKEKTKG